MTPSLSVFVQCPKVLRPGWDVIRAAIEASDIGTNYTLCMQTTERVRDHFLAMLDQMVQADTDLVLRLEDDAEVNRNIVHNIVTWSWLHDPDFGLGWLLSPRAAKVSAVDRIYQRRVPKEWWNPSKEVSYSLAIVMWRRDIPTLREGAARWFEKKVKQDPLWDCAQDHAISYACWELGKRIAMHVPSLVEHRIDLPSQFGHEHPPQLATSCGTFDRDWRRPDSELGAIDATRSPDSQPV